MFASSAPRASVSSSQTVPGSVPVITLPSKSGPGPRPGPGNQQLSGSQSAPTPRSLAIQSSRAQRIKPPPVNADVSESGPRPTPPLETLSSLENDEPTYANLFTLHSLYANVNVMSSSASAPSYSRKSSTAAGLPVASSQPTSPSTASRASLDLFALANECPVGAGVGASTHSSSSNNSSPESNTQHSPASSAGGSAYAWNAGGEADTSGHSSLSPSCRDSVHSSGAGEQVTSGSPAVSEPTSPVALSYDEASSSHTGTVIRRAISKDSANVDGAGACVAPTTPRASSAAQRRRDSFCAATSDSALDLCTGQTPEEKAAQLKESATSPTELRRPPRPSEQSSPSDEDTDTDRTLVQEQPAQPSTHRQAHSSTTPGCYNVMAALMSGTPVQQQTAHSNSSTLTRTHTNYPSVEVETAASSPVRSEPSGPPAVLPIASMAQSIRSESNGEATPNPEGPNSPSVRPVAPSQFLLHESSQSLANPVVTQHSPTSQLVPPPQDAYYNSWPRKVPIMRTSSIITSSADSGQSGNATSTRTQPNQSSNACEIQSHSGFAGGARQESSFVVYSTLCPRESVLPSDAKQVGSPSSDQSTSARTSWPLAPPEAFPSAPPDSSLAQRTAALAPGGEASDSASNAPTPPPAFLPLTPNDAPDSEAAVEEPMAGSQIVRGLDSLKYDFGTKHSTITRPGQRARAADQFDGGKSLQQERCPPPPGFADSPSKQSLAENYSTGTVIRRPKPSLKKSDVSSSAASSSSYSNTAIIAAPTRAEYVNICVTPPGRRNALQQQQQQYEPLNVHSPNSGSLSARVADDKRADRQSPLESLQQQIHSSGQNRFARNTIHQQYGPSFVTQKH